MNVTRISGLAALLLTTALVWSGVAEDNLVFFSPDEAAAQDSELSLSDPNTVDAVPFRKGLNALRDQYLKAAEERVKLMDESELRAAVEQEQKMVAELRAQQSLRQVEQQLRQITEEYSETHAGRQAARLLRTLTTMEHEPVADPGFSRESDGFERNPFSDPDARSEVPSGSFFNEDPRNLKFDDDF